MKRKISRHIKYLLLTAGLVFCIAATLHVSPDAIDPDEKWAWGTNVGWVNFAPTHGRATVYGDHLEGYVWGENIGWIRLGTHTGGGSHTYGNTSPADYGVNRDTSGKLSGYAWSSNVGWINFDPANGGVTVDPASGLFHGYAWAENVGWIKFRGRGSVEYGVSIVVHRVYLPAMLRSY